MSSSSSTNLVSNNANNFNNKSIIKIIPNKSTRTANTVMQASANSSPILYAMPVITSTQMPSSTMNIISSPQTPISSKSRIFQNSAVRFRAIASMPSPIGSQINNNNNNLNNGVFKEINQGTIINVSKKVVISSSTSNLTDLINKKYPPTQSYVDKSKINEANQNDDDDIIIEDVIEPSKNTSSRLKIQSGSNRSSDQPVSKELKEEKSFQIENSQDKSSSPSQVEEPPEDTNSKQKFIDDIKSKNEQFINKFFDETKIIFNSKFNEFNRYINTLPFKDYIALNKPRKFTANNSLDKFNRLDEFLHLNRSNHSKRAIKTNNRHSKKIKLISESGDDAEKIVEKPVLDEIDDIKKLKIKTWLLVHLLHQ